MNTIWTTIATVYRDSYGSEYAYRKALKKYRQHYGFSVNVSGGVKFFEFEDDLQAWQNQK